MKIKELIFKVTSFLTKLKKRNSHYRRKIYNNLLLFSQNVRMSLLHNACSVVLKLGSQRGPDSWSVSIRPVSMRCPSDAPFLDVQRIQRLCGLCCSCPGEFVGRFFEAGSSHDSRGSKLFKSYFSNLIWNCCFCWFLGVLEMIFDLGRINKNKAG